jgi:hypothetical protein
MADERDIAVAADKAAIVANTISSAATFLEGVRDALGLTGLTDIVGGIAEVIIPTPPPVPTQAPLGAAYRSKMNQGDLPWALVMMPTTSSGQSGIGVNKHGLHPESWVVGFFADGDNCQQPIIVGTLPGGPGKGSYIGQIGTNLSTIVTESAVNATNNVIENLVGSNVEKGMTFLIKSGYTAEQSAGILGCLQVESGSGLNTKAFNSSGGGQGAYGVAQWRGPRQEALRAFANQYGNGEVDRIEVQLGYLVKELKEMHQYSGPAEKLLLNTRTPQDAAIAFAHYERGEDYSPQAFRETGCGCQFDEKYLNVSKKPVRVDILKKRINNATTIYQSFTNKATAAPKG